MFCIIIHLFSGNPQILDHGEGYLDRRLITSTPSTKAAITMNAKPSGMQIIEMVAAFLASLCPSSYLPSE